MPSKSNDTPAAPVVHSRHEPTGQKRSLERGTTHKKDPRKRARSEG